MEILRTIKLFLGALMMLAPSSAWAEQHVIWKIGESDNSTSEFALAPAGYEDFVRADFGYEDRYFLVGHSDPKKDFPYVLPGPDDRWAGSSHAAGCRTQVLNILFALEKVGEQDQALLTIDLAGLFWGRSVLKVMVNEAVSYHELANGADRVITGDIRTEDERLLKIPLQSGTLHNGGNQVALTILEGAWVAFDQIRLEGSSGMQLKANNPSAFVRSVNAAN